MCQRPCYEPTCDCPACMPPGADRSIEDALEQAQQRTGLRGRYVLRPLARTIAVSWVGDGSRTGLDRAALREAAHALRRVGRMPASDGRVLYVA